MSALERAAEDAEAEAAQRSIRRGRLLVLCALSAALSALVLFDGPRNDTPFLVASLASSVLAFCVFVFSEDARSFLFFRAASRDGGSAHL